MSKQFSIRSFSVLFILILLCSLSGCKTVSPEEASLPKFKIGYAVYPPFMDYDETGKTVGLDADLAREACRRLGYEPEFQLISWSEKEQLLDEGEIDAVWCGFAMTGRETNYQWTDPYMTIRHVAIVPNDSPIRTLSDLKGKRMGTLSGGKTAEFLFQWTDSSGDFMLDTLYTFQTLQYVRGALESGSCDAIGGKEPVWKELLKNHLDEYRFLDEALTVSELGVAFSSSADPELVASFSQVLHDMEQDQTTAGIISSYGIRTAD